MGLVASRKIVAEQRFILNVRLLASTRLSPESFDPELTAEGLTTEGLSRVEASCRVAKNYMFSICYINPEVFVHESTCP